MLALTAAGVFKDLNEASGKMVKGGERIEPDKNAVAEYNQCCTFFEKLREILGRCIENTLN
jgi:ribulose kinase